jgi:hypothetical protein
MGTLYENSLDNCLSVCGLSGLGWLDHDGPFGRCFKNNSNLFFSATPRPKKLSKRTFGTSADQDYYA